MKKKNLKYPTDTDTVICILFYRHADDSLTVSIRRSDPGFGETRENGRHRAALEGSHEDQSLALHLGECHLRSGGRQEHPRALQELQTHPPAAGFARWQLQDHDGRLNEDKQSWKHPSTQLINLNNKCEKYTKISRIVVTITDLLYIHF